jgi:hypothetical protein
MRPEEDLTTKSVETHYIAETWNSLSSVPFLFLSAYAIKTTYGLPHRLVSAVAPNIVSETSKGLGIFSYTH